jgi:cytochrome P450
MDHLSFPFPEIGGAGPAPEFAALRGRPQCPVRLPNGASALLVCRYADLRQLLTDPAYSRAAAARHGMTARSPRSLALNSADPPDHTRRRRAVAPSFATRQAEAMRPEIARIAEDLVTGMQERGTPAELIADMTRPLAVTAICRVMGLPDSDFARFAGPVEVMMSVGVHSRERVDAAHREVFDYFAERYDQRTGNPGRGDVLGCLVRASGPGGSMTREEAIHVGYGLLMAGYETTTHQLAICVYLLLSDRSRWERLREEPALLPLALEELLRWTSLLSTGGAPHAALKTTAVGGVPVSGEQVVVPVFAAANRDPAVFESPDEIKLDRNPNPHVAFGHGRHLCLGAPLARVELAAALDTLLRRLPTLDLIPPAPRWRQGQFIRGLTALPVTW